MRTYTVQPTGKELTTNQKASTMADKTKDQGDRSRKGTRTGGKRRLSPVKDGLRDRPERKPIILANYYPALNYTETLEYNNDHIIVRIQLRGQEQTVTINAMVD